MAETENTLSNRSQRPALYTGYQFALVYRLHWHRVLFPQSVEYGSRLWTRHYALYDCHFHPVFQLSRYAQDKTSVGICISLRILYYRIQLSLRKYAEVPARRICGVINGRTVISHHVYLV